MIRTCPCGIKDAIHKDGDGNFVYCLADGNSVYTPVVTGMTDGYIPKLCQALKKGQGVVGEYDDC